MSTGTIEQDPTGRGSGAERRRRELRALLLAAADTARASRQHVAIIDYVARPVGRMTRNRGETLLSVAG